MGILYTIGLTGNVEPDCYTLFIEYMIAKQNHSGVTFDNNKIEASTLVAQVMAIDCYLSNFKVTCIWWFLGRNLSTPFSLTKDKGEEPLLVLVLVHSLW